MLRLSSAYLVTQQSRDSWSLHFLAHLALPWQNVWACLELSVCQAHQQSVPGSFLSLLGTSHTSSVLGRCHLTGQESWSRCQQSSDKACHSFQTAQDAFWACVPFLIQKIIFWEHASLTTLSESFRSASVLTWEVDKQGSSLSSHVSLVHPLGSQWNQSFEWW